MSAYVTVTDAAGRVLFRRPATAAEIQEAIQVADAADAEAQIVLKRIVAEREANLAAIAEEERHTRRLPPKVVTPIIKPAADTNSEASEEAAEEEAVEEDPHQEFEAEEPPFGYPVTQHDDGDHDL